MTIATVVKRGAIGLVVLAAIALAVVLTTTVYFPRQSPPMSDSAAVALSVMSFNLRYDNPEDGVHRWENRRAPIVDMLNSWQPSLFGVQEALSHQVTFLDDGLPSYTMVGVGRDDGATEGEFCAIFWQTDRFELVDSGTFWLSETPMVPSTGWDASIKRITTWVALKPVQGGEAFFVFNTHFDHQGAEARKASAQLLARKVDEIAGATSTVYVIGDFNALIGNPLFEPLHDRLFSAKHSAENVNRTASFNSFGRLPIPYNIDFIFFRAANALTYRTIDDDFGVPYISDHYPIVAEFQH